MSVAPNYLNAKPAGGISGRVGTEPLPVTRVLVTDNRAETIDLVGQALAGRYVCEFVSTVDRAGRLLDDGGFDLIICCFEVPAASDLALVRRIIWEYPDVAVVLITAEERAAVAAHVPVLGADGYLVKPFGPGQLLITTMDVLDRRAQAKTDRVRHEALLASAEKHADQLHDELVSTHQEAWEESPGGEGSREVSRMAGIAALLGEALELGSETVALLREAAPLRDVGNIETPDHIFRKPGPLTAAERREVEGHPRAGERILAAIPGDPPRMAARIALSHHERWDGSGYPGRLAGAEIPLEGRIAALADSFDAMLNERSYRSALNPDDAIAVIGGERGAHFDPRVVDAFLGQISGVLRC